MSSAAENPANPNDAVSSVDPVLPHEDRSQFTALLERYLSEFRPATAHEEFLVSQLATVRWKLFRVQRIENALFERIIGESEQPDAQIARCFAVTNGTALTRLDRYRANLESTYNRCIRELRAARKLQNEAKVEKLAANRYSEVLEELIDSPPPGFVVRQKLVAVETRPGEPPQTSVPPSSPGVINASPSSPPH